jgi:hypothetical protein
MSSRSKIKIIENEEEYGIIEDHEVNQEDYKVNQEDYDENQENYDENQENYDENQENYDENQEDYEVSEEVNVQEKNKFVYILNLKFVQKYCDAPSKIYKHEKYNYLPFINTVKLPIDQLSNSKFLIYLRAHTDCRSSVVGYYGYFLGGKILINNEQGKNIKNKNNVEINEHEYLKMVKSYCLSVMSDLMFIKYKNIIHFDSIVSSTKYKAMCQEQNLTYSKIPNLKFLNIAYNNIDESIECIESELEREAEEQDNEDDDTTNECVEDKDEIEETEEMIEMNIPIVWNPCDLMVKKMEKMNIKKADIILHYTDCETCDITDNNRRKLDFSAGKINLQIKEGDENKQKMDHIINFYQFDKRYIEKKSTFEELCLFEDKINIIYYKCEEELYDKSIFIISK